MLVESISVERPRTPSRGFGDSQVGPNAMAGAKMVRDRDGIYGAIPSHREPKEWASKKFTCTTESLAELLRGADYRKYSPRMLEPCDRDQRVAPASNSEKLFWLPSVEDASVVGQGCPGVPPRSGSTGWQDHSNPGSRRTAPSVRAPGRMRWAMHLIQSIADFFYLSWHLLRSLFMSQEALEREIAEMRL